MDFEQNTKQDTKELLRNIEGNTKQNTKETIGFNVNAKQTTKVIIIVFRELQRKIQFWVEYKVKYNGYPDDFWGNAKYNTTEILRILGGNAKQNTKGICQGFPREMQSKIQRKLHGF